MASSAFGTSSDQPEQWKGIPGEPYYEASSLGRIRSISRTIRCLNPHGFISERRLAGRVLRPKTRKVKKGSVPYLEVSLCSEGKPHSELVHQLVAFAFHGAAAGGMITTHDDGDHKNNRPGNLVRATQSKNMFDRWRDARARESSEPRQSGP